MNPFSKSTVLAGLLAAASLAPAQESSQVGGLLISPLLHRLGVKSGQKDALTFVAENPGQTRTVLDGSFESFTMADWTYETRMGEAHSRDARDWFSQRTIQVTFEPGQRRELRIPFTVPREARGVYWCMLRLQPRPAGSTTKSLITYDIPIVLIANGNPKPVLSIQSPVLTSTATSFGRRSFTAALPIVNASEGFTPIGAIGELRDAGGRVVASFRLDDRNLMPGTKRQLSFFVPPLTDGNYRLNFRALMGNRALPAVTSDFVVQSGTPKLRSEARALALTPVSLEPGSMTLSMAAGGSKTQMLRIRNNSARPLSIALTAHGVEQGANGSLGPADGVPPNSIRVEIDAEDSPLAPGETRSVRVRVGTAPGTAGDQWFALAAREKGNGAALAESILGVAQVARGARAEVVVEQAEVIVDRGTPVAVKFAVRNSGNVAIRPEATCAVLADGVRLTARPEVPVVGTGGLLPGARIENAIMLPQGLKPGDYVAEISYQYGDRDFAKLRVPIQVKPSRPTAKAPAKKRA